MTKDADPNVVIQAMLTLNLHRIDQHASTIRLDDGGEHVARRQGDRRAAAAAGRLAAASRRPSPIPSSSASSTCRSSCVDRCSAAAPPTSRSAPPATAPDGKGAPLGGATDGTTLAPPLAGSARVVGHRDYVVKVLLHGMTGALDGRNYQRRRDGADGHEHRRVDRRRRQLRAQQLRQPGRGRSRRRR